MNIEGARVFVVLAMEQVECILACRVVHVVACVEDLRRGGTRRESVAIVGCGKASLVWASMDESVEKQAEGDQQS